MAFTTSSLGRLTTLFAAALLAAAPMAAAQTISNTASAEWTVNGRTITSRSNRVDLTITPPSPRQPGISTYRLTDGGGSRSEPVVPTQCQTNSGPIFINPEGAFAGLPTTPASLQPTDSFHAGEVLVVGVNLPSANTDPLARDTLNVTLELENGDREQITLSETAVSSGEFIGIINTIGVPPAIVQGDCRLSVTAGSSISMRVSDSADASLSAIARIDFLVDPYGVVFDSGDGLAVPGSRVTLINTGTGQPAKVYGDDGVSSYPASVLTGQSITDSSGMAYNFPPGEYRFPFVAPGTYRLIVEPPDPYVAPSEAAPAALAGFQAPRRRAAF